MSLPDIFYGTGVEIVRKMGQESPFSSVTQSCPTLCDPWTAAGQASLSITNSRSLLKLMSIKLAMPSNHLIFCRPLIFLPSIFPSIRVFSSESALRIRWPKYWSFSFSITPSNEYSGLISFRIDWLNLLAVQGTLKGLLQHHSSKASIWHSAFYIFWLSHSYMTTGKTTALTRRTFVGKVMSLLFNMLSSLVTDFVPRSKHLLISWLQILLGSPCSSSLRGWRRYSQNRHVCFRAHQHLLSPWALPAMLSSVPWSFVVFTLNLVKIRREAFCHPVLTKHLHSIGKPSYLKCSCMYPFSQYSSEFSTWFECLCNKSDFHSTRGLGHVKEFYINTLCKMNNHFSSYIKSVVLKQGWCPPTSHGYGNVWRYFRLLQAGEKHLQSWVDRSQQAKRHRPALPTGIVWPGCQSWPLWET